MICLQDIFKHDDALTWTLLFLEIQKVYSNTFVSLLFRGGQMFVNRNRRLTSLWPILGSLLELSLEISVM